MSAERCSEEKLQSKIAQEEIIEKALHLQIIELREELTESSTKSYSVANPKRVETETSK